ncbi:MAG: hypothetical protein GXX91_09190 [Verrucomicrobiaceae bacterium]|nr:hypothetical protein [Verrucomicrobiaceae bacterium]
MSSFGNILLALFVLVALVPPRSATGQESLYKHTHPDAGDTFVEVESVFGAVARHGSLPYRITIRNNSGRDRVWTVRLNEGNPGRPLSTGATYRIPVENGSEVRREVTLAFAPAFLAYPYRNLTIHVSATGFPVESRHHGEATNETFPTLAISKPLAQRSLSRLNDAVKRANSSNPTFAKPFEVSYLPSEWEGYSGLDGLLMDRASWLSLTPGQRQALIAWVRLGGILDIYREEGTPLSALNLPVLPTDATASTDIPLSLGSIRLHEWDGVELPGSLIARYRTLPTRAETLEKDFDSYGEWPLGKLFGHHEFNPFFVFVLLLAFAILVAPVNLFYFARPGRRHRLFITTPIISVVTCLLVIVVILFTDGIGGQGIRVVLADLQPARDEMRFYLTQEQISRTGVMVNTGFSSSLIDEISPVRLRESSRHRPGGNPRRSMRYDISGEAFSGNFFPSRSEQGFVLRAAEPTRSRIEWTPREGASGVPRLTSTLSRSIAEFYYRDADGTVWVMPSGSGQTIAPGREIPLEKASSETWPEWLKEDMNQFSKTQRSRLLRIVDEPNRFFARLADGESLALSTHPRLRWENTFVLLTGTPASGPAMTPPAPENAAR